MRLWLGVFGAPGAWALQHVSGYALTEATCGDAGWHVNLDAWTIAVSAGAALVAVAAGTAAALTYRATRAAGEEPPVARIRFLAVIGIAIAPLFLAMILMSGLGTLFLDHCRQG
jgi:hypothetical protein